MTNAETPLSPGALERGSRALGALDAIFPSEHDVVCVEAGQVLVFALDPSGRRLPLATLSAGEWLVGCARADGGTRLIVSGLPGSLVDVRDLDADTPLERLGAWATTLVTSVAAGHWPRKVVAAEGLVGVLAPGENVAATATSGEDPRLDPPTWLSVTSGTAYLCGERGAGLGPIDPPIPVGRRGWLEAGLRAHVAVVPGPDRAEDWRAPLDLLGRAALVAAVSRQRERDLEAVDRLQELDVVSEMAVRDSVLVLSSAVGGDHDVPRVAHDDGSGEFAAAAVVARHGGLNLDADALTRAAGDIETGRAAIDAVAAACGARARSVTLEPGWRQRDGRAVVAWVKDGSARHAVALIPGRGWTLVDPASGDHRSVTDEVAGMLEQRAYELLPVLSARPSSVRDLLRLGSLGSQRDVFWILLMTAGIGMLAFITPYLLGQLAVLFSTSADTSAFVAVFVAIFLTIVVNALWGSVRSLALLRVRARSVSMAAGALWDRMVRQRAAWHADAPLGDRMAQANAVLGASTAVPDETVARLLDTVIVLGSLAAIATVGLPMLVAVSLVIVAQAIAMLVLLRVASRRAAERIDASAAATGRLLEILKAVNRLRVAGAESRAFLRWAQVQARFARADLSLRQVSMLQGVVVAVWPILGLAVIVLVTNATGAGFQAFITAQTATSAAIATIAAAGAGANAVLVARRSLDRATPLLATAPEGGGDGIQPGLLSGGIDARDLVFRYAPDLPPALDRVSLTVRPGENVAIVGPSGCGKTTLMRVLLGLEDPESGVIAVDGRDMSSLDRPAVRRQIGSVLQSSQLLPGPLRGNVDMGRSMTTAEIWKALDDASVGDDVRAMPMGLDTPVTDGAGTISGGQRQRVLIARALAGSPRVLVLDEATSALDNVTQAAVVESLEALRITRIVVAHRLSTIRHADRVIVMEAGRIVDEGTYDELASRPGTFAELVRRQQA